MHVTREMIMGLIPFLVRLVFRQFSNNLADDIMLLYAEVERLETELENVRQQAVEMERRAVEAERQRDELINVLRSVI
jgi:hypothetical protein